MPSEPLNIGDTVDVPHHGQAVIVGTNRWAGKAFVLFPDGHMAWVAIEGLRLTHPGAGAPCE